ncbi:hypothetical protein J4409_01675 [Candidatus Woesearchaeota archaeon]|nr:hypothetical protein [Candidatus Woesearchaeota archaeon]
MNILLIGGILLIILFILLHFKTNNFFKRIGHFTLKIVIILILVFVLLEVFSNQNITGRVMETGLSIVDIVKEKVVSP